MEGSNISSLTDSYLSQYEKERIGDSNGEEEILSLNESIESNGNMDIADNQHENNSSEQDELTTLNQRVKAIFSLLPDEFCTEKNYANAVSTIEHPRTVRLSCLLSEKCFVILRFVFISTTWLKISYCDARSVINMSTQFMAKI